MNITIRQLNNDEDLPYDLLLDADPDRQVVDNYIKFCKVFVAIDNAEIVGVYALYPLSAEIWEIKNIAVVESLQGKGIGKTLLNHAGEFAKGRNVRTLMIGTSNASIGQLYLYQKCGFEITAIKHNFFLDNYPKPLFENGLQVKHMLMLAKPL